MLFGCRQLRRRTIPKQNLCSKKYLKIFEIFTIYDLFASTNAKNGISNIEVYVGLDAFTFSR